MCSIQHQMCCSISSHSLPALQTQHKPSLSLPKPHLSTKPTSHSISQASWLHSLRSKSRSNHFNDAIAIYISMIIAAIPPDNFAFPAVLKAVTGLKDLTLGKQIHAHVLKFGYQSSSVTVANTLVNMYGKCGDLCDVYKVFDGITQRDQVSWNSLISALCQFEEWELVLDEFRFMLLEGFRPSSFNLVSLAVACSNLNKHVGLRLGKQVHCYCLRIGHWTSYISNALMTMYAKLGRVHDAKSLFELLDDRDVVSWNTMLSSFSQNYWFAEALGFFHLMVLERVKPDAITFASTLPACAHFKMLGIGKEIHAYALRNDCLIENSFVGSALVDMYCNCGLVESGRQIFDSFAEKKIALWNTMIAGYAQNEYDEMALELFIKMQVGGICPNATTLASILPSCARCEAFPDKEGIHANIIKRSLESDKYVQNALVDFYSRIGKIEISHAIFNSMEITEVISWNTIITGYMSSGRYSDALLLLHEMLKTGRINQSNALEDEKQDPLKPNSVTLMTVLPGCAALAALSKGKEIHAYALRNALASEVTVGSALVDMYAKCGCLNFSRKLFDLMPVRNVITWNVIIMAYGMHGKGEKALQLFNDMVAAAAVGGRIQPNEVTFIAIFAACSHSGLVDEGLELFYKMREDYHIDPGADHYACIVDLLSRAGRIKEAYELINSMPSNFDKIGAWSSLLGACRVKQNVQIGEIAAKNLLKLEPKVASHYVLLSNLYSSAGMWDKAENIRKKMKEMGVRKEPGCSWIEHGDKAHKFLARDSSHPQSEKLHDFVMTLSERMKKEGYIPDTSCVLHNVDEEEKETLLCGHSEKLAIAFGILNTPPGTTVRVTKNLRVCNDCHTLAKFISRMVDREIILRDTRRFHHFKDGTCSCRDYW